MTILSTLAAAVLPAFCADAPAPDHPELTMFENNYCSAQRIDCGQNHGTGVNLNPDGYILTNAHVVAGGCEIVVSVDSGGIDPRDRLPVIKTYVAQLVASDQEKDLAVIKIDAKFDHFAVLVDVDWNRNEENNDLCVGDYANGAGFCAGQTIYSIGFPLWFGPVVSSGSISKLVASMELTGRDGKTKLLFAHELMFTPEPGGPGTSGSAVFLRTNGRFIGLTAKEMTGFFSGKLVNFHTAVTLDRVAAFLNANGIAYSTASPEPEKKHRRPPAKNRPRRGAVKH